MAHDDSVELLIAQVSCIDAPWISPHNRGKRDAIVSLHNDDGFLWTEGGDTVGWARIRVTMQDRMADLMYVPQRFVGQDIISDNLYLLRYICPVSGKTVQQEINELSSRLRHPVARIGGFVVGHVAKMFVDQVIDDVLRTVRNATHSGYHDISNGKLFFDSPIKKQHLSYTTVGDLRRAGHRI